MNVPFVTFQYRDFEVFFISQARKKIHASWTSPWKFQNKLISFLNPPDPLPPLSCGLVSQNIYDRILQQIQLNLYLYKSFKNLNVYSLHQYFNSFLFEIHYHKVTIGIIFLLIHRLLLRFILTKDPYYGPSVLSPSVLINTKFSITPSPPQLEWWQLFPYFQSP